MGIFKKAEPEAPKPAGGGLALLRARARGCVHLPRVRTEREEARPQAYAWLKEALHISGDGLNAFLAGGPLPLPKVALLIDYLDMRATYDPETDLLKSTAPEPTPVGIRPEPYKPTMTGAEFKAMAERTYAARANDAPPPGPAQLSRPGWAP